MFPEWTWICGLFIGATIGSFLNVVIYRLPLGLSINEPKHSFCPSCKHQLGIPDLVPLFSWLFSGGKCRHCKAKVPSRYFFVELLNGSLWAGIWYQQLCVGHDPAKAITYMLFSAALVAAIFIDLRYYIIPDQINAFILLVGLGYSGWLLYTGDQGAWMWGMPIGVAGAIFGTVCIWAITFLGRLMFGKDAMGHGDIKLARGMGAVLFPVGAGISFALAVVAGAVFGIVTVILRKRSAEPAADEEEDDEPYEPESIGSLLKCGLGYLLAFDAIGLVFPKFYESYFAENPYSVEDVQDEPDVSFTTIPFGPYLAIGALAEVLFHPYLQKLLDAYLKYIGMDAAN